MVCETFSASNLKVDESSKCKGVRKHMVNLAANPFEASGRGVSNKSGKASPSGLR